MRNRVLFTLRGDQSILPTDRDHFCTAPETVRLSLASMGYISRDSVGSPLLLDPIDRNLRTPRLVEKAAALPISPNRSGPRGLGSFRARRGR